MPPASWWVGCFITITPAARDWYRAPCSASSPATARASTSRARTSKERCPMVAYVIADTDITDHKTYDEYRKRVLPLIEKFGGKFIVRGGAHEVLEGDW